ncbi:hypothetical protein TrCOL_g8053 [Triparma columacea]|uniref:Uncharacterized protein n=1 Tax=Triparma columacea TaxID=722753 RepID=A0A9W7LGP8_9STRA|nr:hypothetical protein TrCOL_g8053 [Triparma columacea]
MDDSNTPFERVMAHQTSAFGAIFTMFTELKEANKVLEERVQDLAMGRAKDQLKIKELDEEIKVLAYNLNPDSEEDENPRAPSPLPEVKAAEEVVKKPEVVKIAPLPTKKEPDPVKKELEPVKKEPEPVKKEPEPVKKEPEPVMEEPEPVKEEPEPVKEEPEPVKKEPEPVKEEPKPEPVKKEPEVEPTPAPEPAPTPAPAPAPTMPKKVTSPFGLKPKKKPTMSFGAMAKLKSKAGDARRKTMNMAKERVEKEMTITKRLGRLEAEKGNMEKFITERMNEAIARLVKDQNSKTTTTTTTDNGGVSSAALVGMTGRIEVLERFFHGFDAISDVPSVPASPKNAGGLEGAVPEDSAVEFAADEDAPVPQLQKSNTEEKQPSQAEPTKTNNTKAAIPPITQVVKKDYSKRKLSVSHAKSESHLGLVWQLTSFQKNTKIEIDRLHSEISNLQNEIDNAKKGEDEGKLEESLKADYVTKGGMSEMLQASLSGDVKDDDPATNVALVDFNKRISAALSHLNKNKMEKTLFGKELGVYKETIMSTVKAWNKNSAEATGLSVKEMRSDLEGFKKFMEGLDERIGGIEGSKGVSEADLQLKLSANARVIEDAIKLSLVDDVSRQVNDLTSRLSEQPSKEELKSMMDAFQSQLNELTDTTGYSSNRIQIIIEDMKHKLNEKPAKNTVRALVEAKIKEAKNSLQAPDDTLMFGVTQARCLSCNQEYPHVHGERAKPVLHGLAPVSSTVPDHKLLNATAQYPHGRAGALRPLGLGGKPGVPRNSSRSGTGNQSPSTRAYAIGNVDARRRMSNSRGSSRGSSRGAEGGANGMRPGTAPTVG